DRDFGPVLLRIGLRTGQTRRPKMSLQTQFVEIDQETVPFAFALTCCPNLRDRTKTGRSDIEAHSKKAKAVDRVVPRPPGSYGTLQHVRCHARAIIDDPKGRGRSVCLR